MIYSIIIFEYHKPLAVDNSPNWITKNPLVVFYFSLFFLANLFPIGTPISNLLDLILKNMQMEILY